MRKKSLYLLLVLLIPVCFSCDPVSEADCEFVNYQDSTVDVLMFNVNACCNSHLTGNQVDADSLWIQVGRNEYKPVYRILELDDKIRAEDLEAVSFAFDSAQVFLRDSLLATHINKIENWREIKKSDAEYLLLLYLGAGTEN